VRFSFASKQDHKFTIAFRQGHAILSLHFWFERITYE